MPPRRTIGDALTARPNPTPTVSAVTALIGVVINPERAELGDRVVSGLRELGCEVTTTTPEAADQLGDAIDQLVAEGITTLASIGGDGTQRTAAGRLLGTDVALAVIPGGTVNLLAQVLGVDDVDVAIAAAASGTRREIDVGRMDGEPYLLNASTGWDAAVIEHVDDAAKRFGRLGYTVTGVRQWLRSEKHDVRVIVDGESWYDEPAMTVLVMNVGQRASDSLHLAADAELDDGRLDVVVLRRDDARALLASAWRVLRGRPPASRDMVFAQGRRIVVEWDRDVAVQRDGDELARGRRTEYHVDERPVSVMVPGDG